MHGILEGFEPQDKNKNHYFPQAGRLGIFVLVVDKTNDLAL
jgi:hypothetical protein